MGQRIFGNAHLVSQGVVLDCDPKLVGDSLSVHLSQQGNSAAIWRLHCWVQTAQGWFSLGAINTTPPSLGDEPSRTVAIGTCPGAIGWRIDCECLVDDEIAEIVLQSSRCCTSAIGFVKVSDDGTPGESGDPWLNTFSTALGASFIILPAPGILRSITVRLDGTAATATYYVQIWNAVAAPANGTAVTLANSLLAPVKQAHVTGTDDTIRIDYNELGIEFSVGATIVLSTTEFTKTIAGAFLSVYSAEYRLP